jgi:hypothetical protein
MSAPSSQPAGTPRDPSWLQRIRVNAVGCLEKVVTLNFASWNLISGWLTRLDGLRRAASLRVSG